MSLEMKVWGVCQDLCVCCRKHRLLGFSAATCYKTECCYNSSWTYGVARCFVCTITHLDKNFCMCFSEVSLNLLNSIVYCLWFRLSNLFHGMDKNTPVRYTVYCSLLKVASSCGAIQYIPTELDQVINYCGASSYSLCINSVASH